MGMIEAQLKLQKFLKSYLTISLLGIKPLTIGIEVLIKDTPRPL